MRLFSKLYDRALRWAAHPYAPSYLAALSFAESSFFPIPPDVMLAPMSLAKPQRAWYYATLTTAASVLGGVLGYGIGLLAFDAIQPMLQTLGYWDEYELAKQWFAQWGFWVVLIAGFSPIPYKVFTITAGAVTLSFPLFVIASFIGRGARFFLVAGIIAWGGERMERALRSHVEMAGWLALIALVGAYLYLRI
jgi:membrane protein YqaA with SNARE-associated domain